MCLVVCLLVGFIVCTVLLLLGCACMQVNAIWFHADGCHLVACMWVQCDLVHYLRFRVARDTIIDQVNLPTIEAIRTAEEESQTNGALRKEGARFSFLCMSRHTIAAMCQLSYVPTS
eukprot:GHVQ01037406.1.p1 GENE.GHVQ01037406.1~~GHVQ01037406.1.p1  ORF type:complete len:117 (-),score=3.70 GHVQ01037406.1:793-1143(-)